MHRNARNRVPWLFSFPTPLVGHRFGYALEGPGPAGLDAMETLEEPRDLLGCDPDPRILDFEDEALTGGEHYLGAVQLVEERSTEQPSRDVRWTVLVQEPLER